ncbi:hypothetical protein A2U01_0014600 [Trifolium medium]|uniref:Uncharacterized protein n=1 Tax=Trifolium medium TaxID=97028 RepID=A0A392N3U5_9FABA|nr:hypothetical protein [Trifolium medium]
MSALLIAELRYKNPLQLMLSTRAPSHGPSVRDIINGSEKWIRHQNQASSMTTLTQRHRQCWFHGNSVQAEIKVKTAESGEEDMMLLRVPIRLNVSDTIVGSGLCRVNQVPPTS